jgi:hypothetical protein
MLTITDSRYTTAGGLIRSYITAVDGSTYCFTDKGLILSIAGAVADPVQNFHYVDTNGAIKGAAEWQLDTGQDYLMWCTNTSVARKVFPGADDNVWTDATVDYKVEYFQGADWHPMKNATGSLCIGNKDFVSTYSYAGVWNPVTMSLRPGNIIKCLEERDDYLIIGSTRRDAAEEGHIWNWISSAQNWVQKKKIPIKGVNALVDVEKLILQGGQDGEFFYSDFVNTAPLNSVADGGYCNPYGVAVENDLAIFGMYGGSANPGIYSYGRRMLNRPSAFNLEHKLISASTGSTISEIGAVWSSNGATYASWKTAEANGDFAYGVDMLSTTTRATAIYEGLEFSGGIPHLRKVFDSAKIMMEPLPTGCSLSFKYKVSRNTDWRYANIAGSAYVSGAISTTYSVTGSTEAEFIINDKAKVIEVGVELNPSGTLTPEITAIITYIGDKPDEH